MKAFAYVNPTNEKDAVAALAPEFEKALPLAGGQDLLARMKDYITQPDRIVNVKGALDATVTPANGGLRIGAAMKMVDLAEHADVARMYPAIGAGENQFHAIFGEGPSFIVHPSSLAVPMVAYGATFRLAGPNGERLVPASDYFTMPTLQNVRTENVLAPNELLTHVILPAPGNLKTGHYEVRYKTSHDWPIAFATVLLALNGATVQSARVVMGAVAPIPWRSQAAEHALAGKTITEETAAAAADAALANAHPLSQNAYKIQVAKTAVKRAILRAAGIQTV